LPNSEKDMRRGKENNKRAVMWSPESRADMREIWDYAMTTYPAARAEAFVGGIHDAAENLVELPLLWREREHLGGIRFLPVQPYFICYRVYNGRIEIARVIHQERDLVALIGTPHL
jgi:plasmid stabilization system protein ParE